jgi:hypothetical protein
LAREPSVGPATPADNLSFLSHMSNQIRLSRIQKPVYYTQGKRLLSALRQTAARSDAGGR